MSVITTIGNEIAAHEQAAKAWRALLDVVNAVNVAKAVGRSSTAFDGVQVFAIPIGQWLAVMDAVDKITPGYMPEEA